MLAFQTIEVHFCFSLLVLIGSDGNFFHGWKWDFLWVYKRLNIMECFGFEYFLGEKEEGVIYESIKFYENKWQFKMNYFFGHVIFSEIYERICLNKFCYFFILHF